MSLPKGFSEAARTAALAHPTSVKDAAIALGDALKSIEGYDAWLTDLLRRELLELVYKARHSQNVQLRKAAGDYATTSTVATAEASSRAFSLSYLDTYFIAGRVLGDIRGDELPTLIHHQREAAGGYLLNARLLETLQRRVAGEARVRDRVSDAEVAKIITGLRSPAVSEAG